MDVDYLLKIKDKFSKIITVEEGPCSVVLEMVLLPRYWKMVSNGNLKKLVCQITL